MKIAFLNYFDLKNPENWPKPEFGFILTNYHKAKSLESFADVEYICDLSYPLSRCRSHLVFTKRTIYSSLRKGYIHWATPHLSQVLAAQIKPRIAAAKVDLVISSDTTLIAQLNISQPILLWATNLFSPLINRYPDYSNLPWENVKNLRWFDVQSIRRCQNFIFPSQWAANNIIREFGVHPSRVNIVPYGANNTVRLSSKEIEQTITNRPKGQLNLLFIGVDWERKGGEIVLEIVRQLQAKGIPTSLTLIGAKIPNNETPSPNVNSLGFIDQFTPQGKAHLEKCFKESHILLLPSEAETYGNVLCEANSFGVPVIASHIDGIPTIVRPSCNGYTFPRQVFVAESFRVLKYLFENPAEYYQLAKSSYLEYQARLNWSVVGDQLKSICQSALNI